MELLSRAFRLHRINLRTPLLLVEGKQGFIGCGHLNMGICEDSGDAVAIVKDVKTFDDMLTSEVIDVTSAGQRLGIDVGMTGEDALRCICMPWELRS